MGNIVLIRPADAHSFRCNENDFTLVNVAFQCNALAFLCEHYLFGERLFWAFVAVNYNEIAKRLVRAVNS
jgi:hypothetical protein